MWFRSLLNSLKSVASRPRAECERRSAARRKGAASRPCLEVLEDRCLLSFSPAVSYPAGNDPLAVLTADFNGDSRLDLAVVNHSSHTVSVLLGNTGGTFQSALTSATGAFPTSLAVGDFNGDGKLDLATANASDVSVLRGNGDGAFQAPSSMGVEGDPASVAVGDFNGDGLLDLGVTSNVYFPGTPGYYHYHPGQYCYDPPGSVSACDPTDGYYDYHPETAGYYEGRANVLLGNGGGSFAQINTSVLGADTNPGSAAVDDFNGDGKLDFATVIYSSGMVSVLLGTGAGELASPNYFSAGVAPVSVAVGDVNGDGKSDLAIANDSGGGVSLLLGTGTGAFQAPQSYAVGSSMRSVAVADFNSDAKLDLAAANAGASSVSVLLGTGVGAFQAAENYAVGAWPESVAVGDFDGDLFPDVVAANTNSSSVSVLINDHSGPPPPPSVSINDVTVTEGNSGSTNATFTVTLSAAYSQPVTIHYQTANGTAMAGTDYAAASGDVTIAAGQTSQTFTVAVIGDRLGEATENFVVSLSAPTNAVIGDGQGIATILDDEPRIRINDVAKSEGRSGTTYFTFTVTLSAASDASVTVNFATTNGTATTSTRDYVAKSGTLTFAPGETSKTITIAVKGDRKQESNEDFFVDLSSAVGALIEDGRGIGRILNDD